MQRAWISHSLQLSGLPHRIEEDPSTGDAVIRRESLAVIRSADALMTATRGACARRLRSSRQRGRQWRERAREAAAEEAARLIGDATHDAVVAAADLSRELKNRQDQVRDAAQTLMVSMAHEAARRLLLDAPADWAALSCARLVAEEWQRIKRDDDARLRAHPEDCVALEAFAQQLGWTLVPDGDLSRGHCVLVHAAGSVHADFAANVQGLLSAARSAVESVTGGDGSILAEDPTEGSSPATLIGPHHEPHQ